MSGKPYTVYEVEGPHKRRWTRILLWLFVGLVVVALAVAGGSYLWFRRQVSGANARVSKAAVAALASHPVSTLGPVSGATLDSASGTTLAPAPDPPDSMNILVLGLRQ